MKESTKTAIAAVVVVGIAIVFWLILLSPERDKTSELGDQVTRIQSEVSTEEARAETSLAAKKNYPKEYAALVGMGKAVPSESATPSLLVQLDGLGSQSATAFEGITAGSGPEAGGELSSGATEGGEALAPLGASSGPGGLLRMPYQLEYKGTFFDLADFIHGVDSLVETKDGRIVANGRLVTIDGFTIELEEEESGPALAADPPLDAELTVTTYVTPPGQGLTVGGTAGGPAEETVAEEP